MPRGSRRSRRAWLAGIPGRVGFACHALARTAMDGAAFSETTPTSRRPRLLAAQAAASRQSRSSLPLSLVEVLSPSTSQSILSAKLRTIFACRAFFFFAALPEFVDPAKTAHHSHALGLATTPSYPRSWAAATSSSISRVS